MLVTSIGTTLETSVVPTPYIVIISTVRRKSEVGIQCWIDVGPVVNFCGNARPHVAKPVKTYLETLKWEVLPYLPYSPDIAPSNYYLFRSMAHRLAYQQFRSYEDIEKWLYSWIVSKDEHFCRNGIRDLPEWWEKVVANDGPYFEWFICNHFFTIKLHFHQKNSGILVAHLIQ